MQTPVTIDDVRDAAVRIQPYAHRTPIFTCSAINERAGVHLYFKCENFQKVGAFKFRGACNAIMKMSDRDAARGVVTHSSGNHAQAIALAAKLREIPAHIIMPRTASSIKRDAVRGYGATVYDCEPTVQSREGTAARIAKETGAVLIPPYDHPDIIAGQGTAALEMLEEMPHLNAIIAPIGGGGLMSGTAIAAHAINPAIRLYGAEPSGADDAARSLATGQRQPEVSPPQTIADGLLTGLGELTWPIIRDHVQRIFTVDDAAIIDAMRMVMQRMKIVIEPSAAVAVAAMLSSECADMRSGIDLNAVGVIVSGGNADLDHLPWNR